MNHEDQRLVELQSRLTYMEDLLQVLNEVVTAQSRRIEQLEATCRELAERARRESDRAFTGLPGDDVPPHY